jgi:hypothetical protein
MAIGAAGSGFFDTDVATVVAAFAAVITMAAAVVALTYARRELATAREHAQIDLTFRLYEHQLDPEFSQHVAITADFLRIPGKGEERELRAERRWKAWTKMSRGKRAEILLYLNHLEVVGGLYELGRLDEMAVMHQFGGAADVYWRAGDWFVSRVRDADSPDTFAKWGALAAAYRRYDEENEEAKRRPSH